MAAKAQSIVAQGIGERLVAALRGAGTTPEALADRLGIDAAVLHDIIARDRVRADLVPRLAARLAVEPAWLAYGEEDFEAPTPRARPSAGVEAAAAVVAPAAAGADGSAHDDDATEDAPSLTQADAVARVLRALPDGDRGRALKLAVLDALDASVREDGIALPLAVRGLRRRVEERAL